MPEQYVRRRSGLLVPARFAGPAVVTRRKTHPRRVLRSRPALTQRGRRDRVGYTPLSLPKPQMLLAGGLPAPAISLAGVGNTPRAVTSFPQLHGSNWSFGTGTTNNVLKDGNGTSAPYRWINNIIGTDHQEVFEVVAGSDFDFGLTPNVIRIKKPGVDAFLQWQILAGTPPDFTGSTFILPTAATVGSGYYLRHWRRMNSASTGNNHGDTNRTQTVNRVWWAAPHTAGATYKMHVGLNRSTMDGATAPADTPTLQDYYLSPDLPTDEFLRIDQQLEVVEVISATNVRTRFHVEVRDEGGALLAAESSFLHQAGVRTLVGDYTNSAQANCEYPNADAGSLTMGWETVNGSNAGDLCQVAGIAASIEGPPGDVIEDW